GRGSSCDSRRAVARGDRRARPGARRAPRTALGTRVLARRDRGARGRARRRAGRRGGADDRERAPAGRVGSLAAMTTPPAFAQAARLLGDAGLARLGRATVTVFGVGGVGSFAAEALVRTGVGRVILVDYDRICVTNVNRQLHAMKGTLGKPK